MSKIIGIDLRCLPTDGFTGSGVAHAARALCMRLEESRILNSELRFRFYVPKGARWKLGDIVELKNQTGGALRSAMAKKPCDLLFVPGGSIAPGMKCPAVPWVHDLIIFEHPEWFNQNFFQRKLTTYFFAKGLKKAPIVFAVSEYTKSKIVDLLRIDSDMIVVTGEGGDPALSALNNEQRTKNKETAKDFSKKEFDLKRPFILCLGTVEPRKNIVMLIRAWKSVKSKSVTAPDLVVAGADGWKYDDVIKEIKSFNAAENQAFHRLRTVNDDQKRQLLLAAELVAVPSFDEGFGLTALEAMQAGAPVAVSDAGALPEVTGRAGMLINPQDDQGWAAAISTCANDAKACALRARLGLEQSKKWTWEKAAEIMIKHLQKIV
ncbi:MAG: glycosyltransferase family 4 protein [Patescibacteria group bacterium]